jgi:hypothetical protein
MGPLIPDRPGGWWHEYVCPAHGVELQPAGGEVHRCPYGCRLSGEPYDGAWAALAHQAAALRLRELAVAARSGDRDAAETAIQGLDRYATLYAGRAAPAGAQPWMLPGRMFQQALSEAIWATSLAHAVQTLAGAVPAARLRPAADLLRAARDAAGESRDTLVQRGDFRNNYAAWLNAAGAAASRALALLGEADESASWLTGPHGVAAHAAAAVHPDGWEWEGSTYYHAFVLRAYLLALRGQRPPADLLPCLLAMTQVLADLATGAGTLPALHDTPYTGPRWDEELHEFCLLAGQLPGAPDLRPLAAAIAARLPAGTGWRREEAAGWIPATEPATEPATASQGRDGGSRLWPDAGYAALAAPGLRAILDFGPHGGAHGHLDKLALYLYGPTTPYQPALGVPPYAHPWRRGYYTRTAAHPTLTVDDADQCEATGELLYWRAGRTGCLTALGATAAVHPGVRYERHLLATERALVDVVLARADSPHRFTLHLRTDVDVRLEATAGGYRTDWPGDGGLTGRHLASPAAVLSTAPDLGPADDPQRVRPHLSWQVTAPEATFVSVYSPHPDLRVSLEPGPAVRVGDDSYPVPFDFVTNQNAE